MEVPGFSCVNMTIPWLQYSSKLTKTTQGSLTCYSKIFCQVIDRLSSSGLEEKRGGVSFSIRSCLQRCSFHYLLLRCWFYYSMLTWLNLLHQFNTVALYVPKKISSNFFFSDRWKIKPRANPWILPDTA